MHSILFDIIDLVNSFANKLMINFPITDLNLMAEGYYIDIKILSLTKYYVDYTGPKSFRHLFIQISTNYSSTF